MQAHTHYERILNISFTCWTNPKEFDLKTFCKIKNVCIHTEQNQISHSLITYLLKGNKTKLMYIQIISLKEYILLQQYLNDILKYAYNINT